MRVSPVRSHGASRSIVPTMTVVLSTILLALMIPSHPLRGQNPVPCDATCTGGGSGGGSTGCSTHTTYSCQWCMLPRLCTRTGCWDYAWEGTRIDDTVCNGTTTSTAWSYASCGTCFP